MNNEEPWASVVTPITGENPAKTAATQPAPAVPETVPKVKQRKFANGDRYVGGWLNGLPEGEGKYDWSDGSSYDGEWKAGVKHGTGKYIWSSGASYQGEWKDGCMHGVGAFEAPDGSRYQGGWKMDLKHGLGRKVYANGDLYEGLWAQGKPHGPGRYIWVDFNEYDGEWVAGRMSGQGTFVWKTGERYDGEWEDGHEEGVGMFTFLDGAVYCGFWHGGKKHGVGIYRPAGLADKPAKFGIDSKSKPTVLAPSGGSRSAFADTAAAAAALPDEAAADFLPASHGSGSSTAGAEQVESRSTGVQDAAQNKSQQGQPQQPLQHQEQQQADAVLIKDYRDGKLACQYPVKPSTLAQIYSAFNCSTAAAASRTSSTGMAATAGSRSGSSRTDKRMSVTPLGELVYKGLSAYDLMQQLQLGIRWSVAGQALSPAAISCEPAELTATDFTDTPKQEFPRSGSKITSVHPADDYVWKDYAPAVFRALRSLSGVQPSNYILSLCSNQCLQLTSSLGGHTGALCCITADERYLVKTVTRSEARLLMRLLPQYLQHLVQHPGSLITRFYGLHRLQPLHGQGKRVHFVVMGNVLCTGLPIHKRFDLKGSTAGRSTPAEVIKANRHAVLKDLDLQQSFMMQHDMAPLLSAQLKADTAFLCSAGIMDYSLILGVHYQSHHQQQRQQQNHSRNFPLHDPRPELLDAVATLQMYLGGLQLDAHLKAALLQLAEARVLAAPVTATQSSQAALQTRCPVMLLSTRPTHNTADIIRMTSRPVPGGTDHQQQSETAVLGQHMPAMAVPLGAAAKQVLAYGSSNDLQPQQQGHPVMLYMAIVDVLQTYTYRIKLQNAAKRLRAPTASVSAVAPRYYAKRFMKFMSQVFA